MTAHLTIPDHVWAAAAARPHGVRYTRIPNWVKTSELSNVALRCYLEIGRIMNSKSRRGFPFRRTLAKLIGMSLSAVDRGLRELRAIGALVSRPRFRDSDGGQSSNEYMLPWVPLSELLATCGDTPAATVTADEGGSSPVTSPHGPGPGSPATDSVTSGKPLTSAGQGFGLVAGDEGVGLVIQSYPDEGGTRGAAPVSGSAAAGEDSPPPSTCSKHPNGTPLPCGGCKWHRKNRERWEGEQLLARIAEQQQLQAERAAVARMEAEQRAADAITACRECDDAGQRPDGRVCDHTSEAHRQAVTSAARAESATRPRRYAAKASRSWRTRLRPDNLELPAPAPIPEVT